MTTRRIPRMQTRVAHAADRELGFLGCLVVDGERVYATGGSFNKPTLLVSDDSARSWRRLSHPRTPGLRRLGKHGDTLYLLGEYGMLAASVDSGLTWVRLPTNTEVCLSDHVRMPDGTRLVVGDGGVILRSTDGVAFEQLENDWESRILAIRLVGDVPHVLGYDGTIRALHGTTLTPLSLEGHTPLTDLVVTPAGTWLVIGDGGHVFRSTDGGATFESIPSGTRGDLEAMIATDRGVIVVGNGVMLFSDDDGKTWVKVPNDTKNHLWSIVKYGDGYLIGGDAGEIYTLEVSATETIEVSDDPDDDDDDDNDDDDDDDDSDEDGESAPVTFTSVEDASARWIAEGTAFMDGLNAYVRRVYAVGPNKAGSEPDETRQDMADYVRQQLVAFNQAGQHAKARELFPPAYEPFDYDLLGQEISALAYLRDGRRLARIGADVYELSADAITPIEGVDLFGQSPDRRWVVKGKEDRLDIHDGWDGPVVRTLPRDQAAGGAGFTKTIIVAPEGDAVLTAEEDGIYWITETGTRRLLPEGIAPDSVSYPHAALSPNGRFVAMGTQDTSHIVIDRKTGRRYTFEPASSYPHFALFHDDRPDVLLNSCHGLYGSASICVDLDRLVAGKKNQARVLDRRAWVYAAGSTKFGYLLGDRSGYIWAFDFDGNQQWYTFLGSTMTAMDIAPGGHKLIAGSYAGIVVELDLSAKSPDPRLLTDGPVKDVARWLFWQGHDPMLW